MHSSTRTGYATFTASDGSVEEHVPWKSEDTGPYGTVFFNNVKYQLEDEIVLDGKPQFYFKETK